MKQKQHSHEIPFAQFHPASAEDTKKVSALIRACQMAGRRIRVDVTLLNGAAKEPKRATQTTPAPKTPKSAVRLRTLRKTRVLLEEIQTHAANVSHDQERLSDPQLSKILGCSVHTVRSVRAGRAGLRGTHPIWQKLYEAIYTSQVLKLRSQECRKFLQLMANKEPNGQSPTPKSGVRNTKPNGVRATA